MPSNLAAAVVSPTATVFPSSLSTAYVETQIFAVLSSYYHDGTIERGQIIDGVNPARPARTWAISQRLTTTQLAALLAFWNTVGGGLRPFYFYDPYLPSPGQKIGSNYDATGVSTQGRVTCVFRGNWGQRTMLGRHVVENLTLVEVL